MYYMFLADGFEETEALVTLDIMRRADIDVKTVGIGSDVISGTHNIKVIADLDESHFITDNCDGIILPGGMPGTENLYSNATVINALDYAFNNRKMIAAICAAPIIPGRKGMLAGKNAVCFPGFEAELIDAKVISCNFAKDDIFITAKGAGCVFEFSHAIVSYIKNVETADNVIRTIQHGDIR